MAEQIRKPIPLNPLDVMSTWMFAEPVAGSNKRPNFRVKVIGNVPRLTVKTNVQDDKNNGRIDFHTDLASFSVLLAKIQDIAEGKDEGPFQITYEDHIFMQGKRSDNPMVLATCRIGKDRETGQIYIAVLGHNRPKIQFFFGPSKFHKFQRGDGSEISLAEQSQAYARGFVMSMMPLVQNLLISTFDPDGKNVAKPPVAPGGQGAGGAGGGYQQRSGGGGGYQQRQGGGDYQRPAAGGAPAAKADDFAEEFDNF